MQGHTKSHKQSSLHHISLPLSSPTFSRSFLYSASGSSTHRPRLVTRGLPLECLCLSRSKFHPFFQVGLFQEAFSDPRARPVPSPHLLYHCSSNVCTWSLCLLFCLPCQANPPRGQLLCLVFLCIYCRTW